MKTRSSPSLNPRVIAGLTDNSADFHDQAKGPSRCENLNGCATFSKTRRRRYSWIERPCQNRSTRFLSGCRKANHFETGYERFRASPIQPRVYQKVRHRIFTKSPLITNMIATLSLLCTHRLCVRLDEPVHVHQSDRLY